MALDVLTLVTVNAANLMVLAAILPVIMGRNISLAAGHARSSLLVTAMAWIALLLSVFWDREWFGVPFAVIGIAAIGGGQWLMFQALQGWLGPRRGQKLLACIVVINPLGYALLSQNYGLRIGWSNLLMALELFLVCQATLQPATRLGGLWRWALMGCTLVMGCFTLARAVLGAFFTELYPTFLAPHPVNVAAMLAANVSFVVVNMAVLVAWRQEAEAEMRQQAVSDSLTGLTNRRGWDQYATHVFEQARRHGNPVALIMFDLDHFKRINDTQGHEVGDEVLRMVGRVIKQCRRTSDLAARVGGEEFALLLPQTDQAGAQLFEQRLRQALQAACTLEPKLTVTHSAGLAMMQAQDANLSVLMARADRGLYQAKHGGRNRLEMAA